MMGTITIGERTFPCVVGHELFTTAMMEGGGKIAGDLESMEIQAQATVYHRDDIRYVLAQMSDGKEPQIELPDSSKSSGTGS